ncbi:hypothetical protein [Asticcacaulis sp. AND118]|uniref:hypothetical protein n=1 Tax=Asticcacaulis sp. AND118 TaxID=2840468 RepID=UPI001CFFA4BD|nr:hypothetical protein [Asticcacaulis sp. AND118]UDF05616.1 hypothetical protein LH365_15620 [Asticcacaulis sp. AND118]
MTKLPSADTVPTGPLHSAESSLPVGFDTSAALAKTVPPDEPRKSRPPDRALPLFDDKLLLRLMGKLGAYARYQIKLYPWKYCPPPDPDDFVQDAILDAFANVSGGMVKRIWNIERIDLETFARGHIRSRINMLVHSARATTTTHTDEVETYQDTSNRFKGQYLDEYIVISDLRIDLLNAFSKNQQVMAVLRIVIRDVHYSCTAIARELQWDPKQVQRTWLRIASVARNISN